MVKKNKPAKKIHTHFCRGCSFAWESNERWVAQCPKCGKDFRDGFMHKIRNELYGDDRHPKA